MNVIFWKLKKTKKYDFFGSTKWIKKDKLFVLQAEKIKKDGLYFLQTMVEIYERGYFGSISSGRDFQFFSAHFFLKVVRTPELVRLIDIPFLHMRKL